jgi:hypothetical protein
MLLPKGLSPQSPGGLRDFRWRPQLLPSSQCRRESTAIDVSQFLATHEQERHDQTLHYAQLRTRPKPAKNELFLHSTLLGPSSCNPPASRRSGLRPRHRPRRPRRARSSCRRPLCRKFQYLQTHNSQRPTRWCWRRRLGRERLKKLIDSIGAREKQAKSFSHTRHEPVHIETRRRLERIEWDIRLQRIVGVGVRMKILESLRLQHRPHLFQQTFAA